MSARDTRRKTKFNNNRSHKQQYNKNSRSSDGKYLAAVWHDTVEYCKRNYGDVYSRKLTIIDTNASSEEETIPDSVVVDINSERDEDSDNDNDGDDEPIDYGYPVECVNSDTFDLALLYSEKYDNVCVLNMASAVTPGGGVHKGMGAQEEELFRRSNACLAHPSSLYPMNSNELIYCPEIDIVRSGPKENYSQIEPVTVSMITCAAVRQPNLYQGEYRSSDEESMRLKIAGILQVAVDNKQTCLVLGAFGCGVYRNPPDQVAQIFSEELQKHKFECVGFAILDRMANDKKDKYNNLEVFRKVLSGNEIKLLIINKQKND